MSSVGHQYAYENSETPRQEKGEQKLTRIRIPEAYPVGVFDLDLLLQDRNVLAQIGDRIIVRVIVQLYAFHIVLQRFPRVHGRLPGPIQAQLGQPAGKLVSVKAEIALRL